MKKTQKILTYICNEAIYVTELYNIQNCSFRKYAGQKPRLTDNKDNKGVKTAQPRKTIATKQRKNLTGSEEDDPFLFYLD